MMDILILGGNLSVNNQVYQLAIFLVLLGAAIALLPLFIKISKKLCKVCLIAIGFAIALLGTTFYEQRTTTLNAEEQSINLTVKTIFNKQEMNYDLNDLKLFAVEKGKTSNGFDTYLVSMKIDDMFIPIQEIRQNQTGTASDDVEILNTWLKKYGNPEPMKIK